MAGSILLAAILDISHELRMMFTGKNKSLELNRYHAMEHEHEHVEILAQNSDIMQASVNFISRRQR